MAEARLGRVTLVVEDLDGAAADLRSIFGMPTVKLDVEGLGIRVAIGAGGIELVERTAASSPVEKVWRGPLASLQIQVDDLDEVVAKMVEAGFPLDHTITTPGGVRKAQFGNAFHGLPVLLYQVPPDVDYVTAVTGTALPDGAERPYDPLVGWHDGP